MDKSTGKQQQYTCDCYRYCKREIPVSARTWYKHRQYRDNPPGIQASNSNSSGSAPARETLLGSTDNNATRRKRPRPNEEDNQIISVPDNDADNGHTGESMQVSISPHNYLLALTLL